LPSNARSHPWSSLPRQAAFTLSEENCTHTFSFHASSEHSLVARIILYTLVFTTANSSTDLFWQKLASEATGNFLPHV
jgi:hypothetical protein